MPRHQIDPARTVMVQLHHIGIPETLPARRVMVYRFLDATGGLLYVGVTKRPGGRWGCHRRTARWWPSVRSVLVEWHPHERSALESEVEAIRSEGPRFNTRSSRGIHESRVSAA
jgi:hypothetical protein